MKSDSKTAAILGSRFLEVWQENPVRSSPLSYLVISALLILVYFAVGKLGLMLAYLHPSATPVWPAAGLALAAYLALGYRVWPAILVGAFLVNLTTFGTLITSAGIAIGNMAEGLAGSYLVNRFASGLRVFDRPQSIFRFVLLAALLSTTVSATVGVTTLSVAGLADWAGYGGIWLTWWLGDVVGDLIVAPVLVLAVVNPCPRWDWRKHLEAAILALSLFVVSLLVFSEPARPLNFLCVPFLLWAAFRFGKLEASLAVLIASAFAVWSTLHGYSSVVGRTQNELLLEVQAFMGVMGVMTNAVAAIVAERRRGEETLHRALDLLNRELASDDQVLQDLAGRLIHAQEEERSRIARELHDHVSQRVTLLAIRLDELRANPAIRPQTVENTLSELRRETEEIAEDIDNLSRRLHSSMLDHLGLVPALQSLTSQFGKLHDIQVEFVTDSIPISMPSEVALCLFRVVEEGLNNVAKHSGAHTARVVLTHNVAGLLLTLADTGSGFDPAALDRHSGLGLVSMRERLRLLKGRLRIHSSPSQGTRIEAWIPVSRIQE